MKLKYTFKTVFVLSAICCGLLWSWLFLVDVGRLAVQPVVGYITMISVYLVIVCLSALFFTWSILYLRKLYKKDDGKIWLIKAVPIWAFTEAAVAWLIAIFWMGKNGSVDNILPFSTLTPFVILTPLKYISRFVGMYGLSAVAVMGVMSVVLRKTRKYALYYWAIIIVLCIISYSVYKSSNGSYVVSTIVSEHLGEPKKINVGASRFVVLPEYGLDNYDSGTVGSRFTSPTDKFYFVGSKQSVSNTGHTNVLIFGNSQTGFVNQQNKNRLIPGGEHLSYGVEVLLRLFSQTTYTDFQVRREVEKGNNNIIPYFVDKDLVSGSSVCSSIIAPDDYRNLTNKGATVLTNSASLEIFRGSRLFNWQHRGLAKFMAVANARPFMQSSFNWAAFAIDKDGNQLAEINPTSSKTVQIHTNHKKTLYTLAGEWLAYAGMIIVGYDVLKKRKNLGSLIK